MLDNTSINNTAIPTTEEIRKRKIFQKGIQFCLLILGEPGSGKSTFVNNLCNRRVFTENEKRSNTEQADLKPNFEIISKKIQLSEKSSAPINLDLVLVPDLGNCIDNTHIPNQISKYLDYQFEQVLNEENKINRQNKADDTRPHVCLYFIRATTRGLRELDVMVMKKICNKVNLLPVISKSDLLTEEELCLNKRLISKDLKENEINIYDFGDENLFDAISADYCIKDGNFNKSGSERPERHSTYTSSTKIADILPFSTICGNEIVNEEIEALGFVSHIRKYLWGDIIVEDPRSSDFIFLKNIVLGSHLQDLKDTTHTILYENYRAKKLTQNVENKDEQVKRKSFEISSLKKLMESLGQDIEESFNSLSTGYDNLDLYENQQWTIDLGKKEKLIIEYQKKLDSMKHILQISSTMNT